MYVRSRHVVVLFCSVPLNNSDQGLLDNIVPQVRCHLHTMQHELSQVTLQAVLLHHGMCMTLPDGSAVRHCCIPMSTDSITALSSCTPLLQQVHPLNANAYIKCGSVVYKSKRALQPRAWYTNLSMDTKSCTLNTLKRSVQTQVCMQTASPFHSLCPASS